MINDPDYFENRRFKDTIDDYKIIIKEFEKLYEQTSATYRYVRARIKWNEKIKKRFGRLRLNMRYLRSIK